MEQWLWKMVKTSLSYIFVHLLYSCFPKLLSYLYCLFHPPIQVCLYFMQSSNVVQFMTLPRPQAFPYWSLCGCIKQENSIQIIPSPCQSYGRLKKILLLIQWVVIHIQLTMLVDFTEIFLIQPRLNYCFKKDYCLT